MLKQQRIIIVECDLLECEDCWEDMTLNIEPDETVNDAMNFLREMGWKFDPPIYVEDEEIICHCPYCTKGILKQEQGLYLMENEDE